MTMRAVPFDSRLVQHGDRKIVAQIAHCAQKGCTHEIEIRNAKSSKIIPPSLFNRKLNQAGWDVISGSAYCPTHSSAKRARPVFPANVIDADQLFRKPPTPSPEPKQEIEPVSQPQTKPAVAIKSLADLGAATTSIMDPPTKRRVYRAIDDNWDDDKGRYIGGMTDQRLSTTLNVPRAWVEEVRREVFGDDGGNAEIEEMRQALAEAEAKFTAMAAQASKHVEAAMAAVGALEKHRDEVRDLRKRLERVEIAVLPRR